jgi:transcriptional regulator with XRE-family HTH domain
LPFRAPVAAVPPRENEGGRSASGLLVEGRIAKSDRDTFGPRLRAERERRGISLDTIAAVTNVSADLWDGLERNDVSRWPSGIFARSFVRDYARAIGLDEAEVVNDFCRLFPNGDRRARRLIEAHARIIGHKPKVDDQVGGLPLEGDRRAAPTKPSEPAKAVRVLLAPRTVATVLDTAGVLAMAGGASYVFRTGFYETAGVLAILYYGVATMTLGSSAGTLVVAALRQRMPSLFDAADRRRAHA